METKKKCPVCGNLFEGRSTKIYCCSECKCKAQTQKKLQECKKPKTVQRKKKHSSLSLEQINKRARAEGLTYGQYVAKYS